MAKDKLKELERMKGKLAKLEAELAYEQALELSKIPAKYGFKSAEEFLEAVAGAVKEVGGSKKKVSEGPKSKRRRRAKITDEIKAKVVEAVKAGKTGARIAKDLGVSLPSVQNIKKAAGLVKKR